VQAPGNVELVGEALYGAWLAGICLGTAGMALHHKLCHTLGGTFNLPHAQLHAVMLPYSVACNRDTAPEAMRRRACALDAGDPVLALRQLRERALCPGNVAVPPENGWGFLGQAVQACRRSRTGLRTFEE
jgi:alcohol dehydrogenase class IV